jgi:hypothetical protein
LQHQHYGQTGLSSLQQLSGERARARELSDYRLRTLMLPDDLYLFRDGDDAVAAEVGDISNHGGAFVVPAASPFVSQTADEVRRVTDLRHQRIGGEALNSDEPLRRAAFLWEQEHRLFCLDHLERLVALIVDAQRAGALAFAAATRRREMEAAETAAAASSSVAAGDYGGSAAAVDGGFGALAAGLAGTPRVPTPRRASHAAAATPCVVWSADKQGVLRQQLQPAPQKVLGRGAGPSGGVAPMGAIGGAAGFLSAASSRSASNVAGSSAFQGGSRPGTPKRRPAWDPTF